MHACMHACMSPMEAFRDQCEDEDEGVQCLCFESVVVRGRDLDYVYKRFGVARGISEQLPAYNTPVFMDGLYHRG